MQQFPPSNLGYASIAVGARTSAGELRRSTSDVQRVGQRLAAVSPTGRRTSTVEFQAIWTPSCGLECSLRGGR